MIRLKELREEKGVFQKEIANLLDISQQHYSRYEKEELSLPIDKYKILSKYYDTSIDYLVGNTDERKPYPKIKKTDI